MEDALIAPEGIAILTGAGLIAATDDEPIYTHVTENIYIDSATMATITNGVVKFESVTLSDVPESNDKGEFGVYLMLKDPNGDIVSEPFSSFATGAGKVSVKEKVASTDASTVIPGLEEVKSLVGYTVFADYYVKKKGDSGAMQIDIAADKFAGSYYIEGSTLWRDYYTGRDDAAEIIIPNGKIQTNFTFTMAGTGDPSTFSFTVDALKGRLKGSSKEALAAIQIIPSVAGGTEPSREQTDAEGVEASGDE